MESEIKPIEEDYNFKSASKIFFNRFKFITLPVLVIALILGISFQAWEIYKLTKRISNLETQITTLNSAMFGTQTNLGMLPYLQAQVNNLQKLDDNIKKGVIK